MKVKKYLKLAADAALGDDVRHYRIGAVALRHDGKLVTSRNGATPRPCLSVHAEIRLLRKIGRSATLFVCRIIKNGSWALAKPCHRCQPWLSALKCTVYYSTGPNTYEVLNCE